MEKEGAPRSSEEGGLLRLFTDAKVGKSRGCVYASTRTIKVLQKSTQSKMTLILSSSCSASSLRYLDGSVKTKKERQSSPNRFVRGKGSLLENSPFRCRARNLLNVGMITVKPTHQSAFRSSIPTRRKHSLRVTSPFNLSLNSCSPSSNLAAACSCSTSSNAS